MARVPPPGDPKFLTLFTLYALLLGVFSSISVELLKRWQGGDQTWTPLLWWFVSGGLIGLAVVTYDPTLKNWLQERRTLLRPVPTSTRYVRPARGILLLVSKGDGVRSAINAAGYHMAKLEAVYLVHSSDPDSIAGAGMVEAEIRKVKPSVRVEQRQLVDLYSIETSKLLVESIRLSACESGISDEDFVYDFTGMTKPASAGVVLACLRPEYRLEYMEPKGFLQNGAPDPSAGSKPVEVNTAYDIERA